MSPAKDDVWFTETHHRQGQHDHGEVWTGNRWSRGRSRRTGAAAAKARDARSPAPARSPSRRTIRRASSTTSTSGSSHCLSEAAGVRGSRVAGSKVRRFAGVRDLRTAKPRTRDPASFLEFESHPQAGREVLRRALLARGALVLAAVADGGCPRDRSVRSSAASGRTRRCRRRRGRTRVCMLRARKQHERADVAYAVEALVDQVREARADPSRRRRTSRRGRQSSGRRTLRAGAGCIESATSGTGFPKLTSRRSFGKKLSSPSTAIQGAKLI